MSLVYTVILTVCLLLWSFDHTIPHWNLNPEKNKSRDVRFPPDRDNYLKRQRRFPSFSGLKTTLWHLCVLIYWLLPGLLAQVSRVVSLLPLGGRRQSPLSLGVCTCPLDSCPFLNPSLPIPCVMCSMLLPVVVPGRRMLSNVLMSPSLAFLVY